MTDLRLACPDDIPALTQLIALSARGLSGPYYSSAQIEGLIRFVFGVDTQLIADGTYYVIAQDAEIVACGGWSRRRTLFGGDQAKPAEDPLLDPRAEPARIRAFFVHPDAARQGLGSRLLRTSLDAAQAAGFGTLELAATLPGEPLYRSFGFRVIERFDFVLPNGESAPLVRMGYEFGKSASPDGAGTPRSPIPRSAV